MLDKRSLFLFVSCWLLLAAVTLPSGASAALVPQGSVDGGCGTPETFPILQDQAAVQQADLAYLAAKEATGMQATIRYIAARNGSTAVLTGIADRTRETAGLTGMAGSSGAHLEDLRELTRQFRDETNRQMIAVNGSPETLRAEVQAAVDGSDALKQLLDTYWTERESAELSDFDERVTRNQNTLNTLAENGHETGTAQEKLSEIITMRTELATALRARNNAGIELAHQKIHTTSVEYARILSNLKSAASADTRLGQTIDQGISVMTRSGMVNSNLEQTGIDTSHARELVVRGKTQILEAKSLCRTSGGDNCRASLARFRDTLKSLRDTYHGILVNQDLPEGTAQGVLSVAQSLDVTAAQVSAA